MKAVLRFVYPSFCLHCQETEVVFRQLLCSCCSELIEKVPLDECDSHKAAAVSREGAAGSLVRGLNGYARQEILKTMASCMILQFLSLKWPIPDAVIPFPESPLNKLLAKEFSSLFCLKKRRRPLSDQIILVIDLEMKAATPWHSLEEKAPKEVFWLGFCK